MSKLVRTAECTVEATAEPEPSEEEVPPAEGIPPEEFLYVSPASDLQDSVDWVRLGIGREHKFALTDKTYVVVVNNPEDPRFREADYNDIKGVLDRGTYAVFSAEGIPKGATVLRSRMIHSITYDEQGSPIYKSSRGIQGHNDMDKGAIDTEAQAILRSSVCLII